MIDTARAHTGSVEETMALAAALAPCCRPNDVIGLEGTLGAGKTCFVKGLASGLGVEDTRRVVSPTFVLMRIYEGRLTVYHFDAYRLTEPDEMVEIGAEEIFSSRGVSVVEWADHVAACMPEQHFVVSIRVTGPTEREFRFSAHGAGPSGRLAEWAEAVSHWRV